MEASAAAGAVQKQALAHPEISFRLIKDGEPQLRTPGDGDLLAAVYAVLGRQAANEMIPVESRWEGVSVSGFIDASHPSGLVSGLGCLEVRPKGTVLMFR